MLLTLSWSDKNEILNSTFLFSYSKLKDIPFSKQIQSNPMNTGTVGTIEIVHINGVSVLGRLHILEKNNIFKPLSVPSDEANCP